MNGMLLAVTESRLVSVMLGYILKENYTYRFAARLLALRDLEVF